MEADVVQVGNDHEEMLCVLSPSVETLVAEAVFVTALTLADVSVAVILDLTVEVRKSLRFLFLNNFSGSKFPLKLFTF